MRSVNPEDLERLAELLDARDGQSGTAFELQQLFLRASALDARGELSALEPLQSWAMETADNLRRRAEIARSDESDDVSWREGKGIWDASMGVLAVVNSFTLPQRYTGGFPAPVGGLAANLALLGAGRDAIGLMARPSQALARVLPDDLVRLLGGNPRALSQNLLSMGRNTYAGLRAAGGGVWSSVQGTARHLGSAGGVLRWAGIGGGVLGTTLGISDLAAQGDPWRAFQNDPSGYAVDVTGTLFNATMTAALVFPGPWTAIPAGVCAAAYGTALVVDNWEAITGWMADAGGWLVDSTVSGVADAADSAVDAVGDAADAAGDFIDGAGDALGSLF